MKLTYLVSVHNETETLQRLLDPLFEKIRGTTDSIVILDDNSTNEETIDYIMRFFDCPNVGWVKHSLNNDYGAHKNFGNTKCLGDWIFQIDGDERPHPNLLDNVKDLIESNPSVELIYVPRVNDFRGVTPELAAPWGWRLTPCPEYENRPIVNWPDYQGRIYKNDPTRIRWDRKLHEKIEGHKEYSFLPAEVEWSLYHDKTIETQLETNRRYNKDFSVADNKGHKVV